MGPMFMKNAEEMGFSLPSYVCNKLGITAIWSWIHDEIRSRSAFAGRLFWYVGLSAAICSSFIAVPVPAKTTLFVGKPVPVKKGEHPDEVANRAKAAMEELIAIPQPMKNRYF